jgi:hypothetical protein
MALADIQLLSQMDVSDNDIVALAEQRCLSFSMDAQTAALARVDVSAELIGRLAILKCKAAGPALLPTQSTNCPPAYQSDPGIRGCLEFRREQSYGVANPYGECQINVFVDGTVDFLLQGGLMRYEVASGGPPRDVASNCSGPFPTAIVEPSIGKRRGRGKVFAVDRPSKANGFTFRIRVEDSERGEDQYRISIRWATPK